MSIEKTEQSKYSDVLRTMRSDAKLVNLEADERSIGRTRTDEMILELMRDKERKDAAYKSLAEEVLGEGVEVMALRAVAKVKNLKEVTETKDSVFVQRLCVKAWRLAAGGC